MTRKEARAAGLPDVGVRIDEVPKVFAALKAPNTGTYLSLGGPPGDTLMFVVRGYRGPADVAAMYKTYLKESGAISRPLIEGAPESVALGGAPRPARAFITGKQPARANWCVVLVASPREKEEGLMILAGVGAVDSDSAPACAKSLDDEQLRPLVKSLVVE